MSGLRLTYCPHRQIQCEGYRNRSVYRYRSRPSSQYPPRPRLLCGRWWKRNPSPRLLRSPLQCLRYPPRQPPPYLLLHHFLKHCCRQTLPHNLRCPPSASAPIPSWHFLSPYIFVHTALRSCSRQYIPLPSLCPLISSPEPPHLLLPYLWSLLVLLPYPRRKQRCLLPRYLVSLPQKKYPWTGHYPLCSRFCSSDS